MSIEFVSVCVDWINQLWKICGLKLRTSNSKSQEVES